MRHNYNPQPQKRLQAPQHRKTIINPPNAPAPIGPYSQAVLVNGTLYASGQIAINPKSGGLILDNIEAETTQVMANIEAVLAAANMNFGNIIKSSIFLSDMGSFAQVNEVYGRYFTGDFPARETVEVACLPKNVNVEISVVAVA